jgi:hypothetical protein
VEAKEGRRARARLAASGVAWQPCELPGQQFPVTPQTRTLLKRSLAKCFYRSVMSNAVPARIGQIGASFFVLAGLGFAGEPTVCDLSYRSDLQGKTITVAGRMAFTGHGSFLVCDGTGPDVVVPYPKTDNAPHVDFDLDAHAVELVTPFFRPAGGTATACGVVRGQLFAKRRFRVKRSGAGPAGNGFGNRGAFQFAFVLHSVQEIRRCN